MTTKNKHAWLSRKYSASEYIGAEYYAKILHPYTFGNTKDLELFRRQLNLFLKGKTSVAAKASIPLNFLELGCGSGRGTEVLQKSNVFKEHNVDLVDLSQQMLDATYNQYGTKENIRFFCAEILSYLEKTDTIYDFAYALWSLSHSLHQLIGRVGEEDGTAIINATLEKFITRNIRSKGQVFIIHFDSLSPEQQISMDIRRRKYPFYRQGEQSPSKQILDKTFQQLSNKGIIRWSCSHFVGNPIIYDSMEEALEVFFNFHMECEFNSDPRIDSYINRVEYLLAKNQEADGKIRIAPGCFIYVIDRL